MTAKEARQLSYWNLVSNSTKRILLDAIEQGKLSARIGWILEEDEKLLQQLGYKITKTKWEIIIDWGV